MPAGLGDNSDSKHGTNAVPSIISIENSPRVYGIGWVITDEVGGYR
jgi:hypothetical protein